MHSECLKFPLTVLTVLPGIQVGQDWLSDHFQARQAVHFQELQRPEVQSACGEVDLVGYVVTTADTHGRTPSSPDWRLHVCNVLSDETIIIYS